MQKNVVRTLILIHILVLAFNVAHVTTFGVNSNTCFAAPDSPSTNPNIILSQDFNGETTGTVPQNWNLLAPWSGDFTVDDKVHYGQSGKSAKLIANSTEDFPSPFRDFIRQTGTIVVTFAIMLSNNTGNNTGLEVFVDDGYFAGSDILFKEDGTIRYRDREDNLLVLREYYVPNRWYRVKMIINVPDNVYNIYIDDHLEAVNVGFTSATNQINRIIIAETPASFVRLLQPIAHIDDVEIRKSIKIPDDFPTIQEGIDAANPGDTIYVGKNRVYFENLVINKTVSLVGEDRNTTVIDGRFIRVEGREINGISIIQSDRVTIDGFTINCSAGGGARVYVDGSSNTITNSIIKFGLSDGIRMIGDGNTVTSNIVESNLGSGILMYGSDATIQNNTVRSNDGQGIYVDGQNSIVTDNIVDSNLDCGIRIIGESARNSVANNTIRNNAIGIRCDTYTGNSTIYQNRFVNNTLQAVDFGSNKWDDGYPYRPDEKKGGGNYWSDFISSDLYSGVSQELPGPDGVCDKPYNISSDRQDHYPLFLLANITQTPVSERINYNDTVKVNATALKGVQITRARLYVSYDNNILALNMSISGNRANGTIPSMRYGTIVYYNVSILADGSDWFNSTNYPLPRGSYNVTDEFKPIIYNATWLPPRPNENQTVTVVANVNDRDLNASGVAKVFLSYEVDGTVWTAEMRKADDDNYAATIPRQPGNTTLRFNVTAYDRAGNWADSKGNGTLIRLLAILSVRYGTNNVTDPCDVDFEVMSRNQKKSNSSLRIYNLGNETLGWNINVIVGDPWLKVDGLAPVTTPPGGSTPVNMTVDTSYLKDPCNYAAELSITANGTVRQWGVVIRVIVRHITIDESWSSLDITQRGNVNSIQNCSFRAMWAHNSSVATGGYITVGGQTQPVNDTGWATFSFNYSVPTSKTFSVEKVSFPFSYKDNVYNITSFTTAVLNRTLIWDRVNIILKITDDFGQLHSGDDAARIDVGTDAHVVWNSSVYEVDNSPFQGYPLFNETLYHDVVSYHCINAISIVDTKYNLKAFKTNYACCVWDRVKIIGKDVSIRQTNVGQYETVWAIGIYEFENQLIKGQRVNASAMGALYLSVYEYDPWAPKHWRLIISNDSMTWSTDKDQWEWKHLFSNPNTRAYRITKVDDYVYNLTKIDDSYYVANAQYSYDLASIQDPDGLANVQDLDNMTGAQYPQGQWDATWTNPFQAVWKAPIDNQTVSNQSAGDQSVNIESVQTQPMLEFGPLTIMILVVPVVVGSSVTLLILMKSGKKHMPKRVYH